jgi:predicted transcriptional regulator
MSRKGDSKMLDKLSPRERQIVDFLYANGEATAASICEALPDAPGNSAVRVMLSRLEAKGIVCRRATSGRSFVYAPVVPEAAAKQSALSQVVRTFFNGSPLGAATALLGMSEKPDPDELDKLEKLLAKVRKEQTL